QRTTVASANGSPRRRRSPASMSRSSGTRRGLRSRIARLRLTPGLLDLNGGERGRSSPMPPHPTDQSLHAWLHVVAVPSSNLVGDAFFTEQAPDLGRRDRDVDVAHAEMPERV